MLSSQFKHFQILARSSSEPTTSEGLGLERWLDTKKDQKTMTNRQWVQVTGTRERHHTFHQRPFSGVAMKMCPFGDIPNLNLHSPDHMHDQLQSRLFRPVMYSVVKDSC